MKTYVIREFCKSDVQGVSDITGYCLLTRIIRNDRQQSEFCTLTFDIFPSKFNALDPITFLHVPDSFLEVVFFKALGIIVDRLDGLFIAHKFLSSQRNFREQMEVRRSQIGWIGWMRKQFQMNFSQFLMNKMAWVDRCIVMEQHLYFAHSRMFLRERCLKSAQKKSVVYQQWFFPSRGSRSREFPSYPKILKLLPSQLMKRISINPNFVHCYKTPKKIH